LERRNFAQILKYGKIDIEREYSRLYNMFYCKNAGSKFSFRAICEEEFYLFPFKGTCLSLDDFDESHGFDFMNQTKGTDVNHLVSFCEYLYNIAQNIYADFWDIDGYDGYREDEIISQIEAVIEAIGFMQEEQDGLTIFVPKSQSAIVVSEMLPPNLSYKVIEYNHHSMKGDLARKQATLKLLADQLEAKQKELNQIDKQFKSDLFYLLNNMNIRHNNIEPTAKEYKKAVAEMTKEELEHWYDEIYDMCLYAFMTLDQADRNAKVKELKAKIECNK